MHIPDRLEAIIRPPLLMQRPRHIVRRPPLLIQERPRHIVRRPPPLIPQRDKLIVHRLVLLIRWHRRTMLRQLTLRRASLTTRPRGLEMQSRRRIARPKRSIAKSSRLHAARPIPRRRECGVVLTGRWRDSCNPPLAASESSKQLRRGCAVAPGLQAARSYSPAPATP